MGRKIISLLACFLLTSCAMTHKNTDRVTHSQVLSYAAADGYILNDWKVLFTPHWFGIERGNKLIMVDGVADPQTKAIYLTEHSCLGDSAILHERAHVIHNRIFGSYDGNHIYEDWWQKVKEREKKMVRDLCPKGYKHKVGPSKFEPAGELPRGLKMFKRIKK